eukprot:TRINITY_DN65148_c0_g1_i1.p1 TRINITY_DN65148_c0_g1~~TRINITY_DN65148_c0_g1_i1.p1  ORF type:complete len:359 (+),score=93.58 TRINITY_DN65148_c0_g1_i1:84-1079(+)
MAADGSVEWRVCVFPSGAEYRGGLRGAHKHGRGYWTHPEGESYEGEYRDNQPHGWGVYSFADGVRTYSGQWERGEMCGSGVYSFSREGTEWFVGQYKADRKNGAGVYCFADGRVTAQQWDMGDLCGESDATPAQQFAAFRERLRIDRGCSTVGRNPAAPAAEEDGDEVERQFAAEIVTRTHTYPSGASYEGEMLGPKKHGSGVWRHPEGDRFDGFFRNNKQCGWGVYEMGRTGKKYVGGWREGKMHGWGVYFFSAEEDEHFVGTYRADKKHGLGVYTFSTGQRKLQRWGDGQLEAERDADAPTAAHYDEVRRLIMATTAELIPARRPPVMG